MKVLFAALLAYTAMACSPEYSACTTRARLNQANCNGLVATTPTFEYWDCLCNTYTSSLNCYSLCGQDTELQKQRLIEEQNSQGTCNYVAEQKKLGKGAPKVKTSQTVIGTKTISSTIPSLAANESLPPVRPPSPPSSGYNGPVSYSSANALEIGVATFFALFGLMI
jgi:hypothetical protein